jgi:hypothetical protein
VPVVEAGHAADSIMKLPGYFSHALPKIKDKVIINQGNIYA